jgi:hypothetical protein
MKPLHLLVAKRHGGPIQPENSSEQRTWQMWSTPLVHESLGLQGHQSSGFNRQIN